MPGFTLIETIVTIFIFTLIMGAAAGFIVYAYRTYSFTFEQSSAVSEARRGIETMVREIRTAASGEDGSYTIEKAADKEFIFYSDIDKDGLTERVRYFLGSENSGSDIKQCVTFTKGGACSVSFSNFLQGALQTAQLRVSVEGDFGSNTEYADIIADGQPLNPRVCQTGCVDCSGSFAGNTAFDVTNQAGDNNLLLTADASSKVDPICQWQEPNHAMKARFELSWQEQLAGQDHLLKKGVVEPVGLPASYPLDQELITIISSYVRNAPPIFQYYDNQGNKLTTNPTRISDTKLMRIYLLVDVDPNKLPSAFELESSVKLRNL